MNSQLRIACLGDYQNYYSYFLYGAMEGAILNGAWFRPIPLFGTGLESVKAQLNFFKPHILLIHMIFNKRPYRQEDVFQILRDVRLRYGTKVFYHMGDARKNPRHPEDISNFVDAGLVNNGLYCEFSNIWHVPCFHWPYPCLQQEKIYHRSQVPEIYHREVVFTGSVDDNMHHKERADFIKKLKEAIDVTVFPIPITGNTRFQTADVSGGADAVLGVQMGLDIPLYLDVRPFQYIGSGALYFHDNCDAMNYFFDSGTHFVSYERNNSEDFLNNFYYYTQHNKRAGEKIRMEGFAYAQKYHSTKARMNGVIQISRIL